MNTRQRKFADCYLGQAQFNCTKAAKMAGYSEKTAYSIGARLLKNVEVQEYIKTRLEESAMSSEENLMHIAEIARGQLGPGFFLDETTEKIIVPPKNEDNDQPPEVVEVKRISINWKKVKKYGRLIKSLTFTANGPKIELYDRLKALEDIGKHYGLFDRGSEDKPLTVNNINYTVDEWQAEQARRRAEVAETMELFDDEAND